jgi:dsRNA-specific ribonuclease
MTSEEIKKIKERIKHKKKKTIKRMRTKLDIKIKLNKIFREKIKKNLKYKSIKSKTNNN